MVLPESGGCSPPNPQTRTPTCMLVLSTANQYDDDDDYYYYYELNRGVSSKTARTRTIGFPIPELWVCVHPSSCP